jgi:hypothetical protein
VHGFFAPLGGRQRTENIEAEGTARHYYDKGLKVVTSRRLAGGSAGRTSMQWGIQVTTAQSPPDGRYHMDNIEAVVTAGHHYDSEVYSSGRPGAGRAASHGEHQGSGRCRPSLHDGEAVY